MYVVDVVTQQFGSASVNTQQQEPKQKKNQKRKVVLCRIKKILILYINF